MENNLNEFDDELDDIIDELAERIAKDEMGTHIMVLDRVRQVAWTYQTMKAIAKGESVKVTYTLNQPFTSTGSVSIVGEYIEIEDVAKFSQACSLASNFEVLPKTDGTVEMNFAFHGLTRKVKG